MKKVECPYLRTNAVKFVSLSAGWGKRPRLHFLPNAGRADY